MFDISTASSNVYMGVFVIIWQDKAKVDLDKDHTCKWWTDKTLGIDFRSSYNLSNSKSTGVPI